jgi:protein-tyrosine phosphatase
MVTDLDWEGTYNVRDLGGLRAGDGGSTRFKALVRGDSLEGLTARGWEQALEHGIRTVVDLRNPEERGGGADRPGEIETIEIPLDCSEDREFWDRWESSPAFATPAYYREHIERFPERNAEVIAAIADAPDGAVAFHCVSGRDRSGQIAMLTLALAGVETDDIVADYERSGTRLRARYVAYEQEDQGELVERYLTEQGTTFASLLEETLAAFDLEAHLGAAGLPTESVGRLRGRLLTSS